MSFKFEKIGRWQKSMEFGEEIFQVSQNFQKEELFDPIIAFRNQIK